MNTSRLVEKLGIGLVAGATALMPIHSAKADYLEIDNYAGPGVGGSALYLGHVDGASEGADGYDLSGPPSPPSGQWLKIYTSPYGSQLAIDSRPAASYTVFNAFLSVVDTLGTGVTSTNFLTFSITDADPSRAYTAQIHLYDVYTPNGQDFNLTTTVFDGMNIALPGIKNVPNGAVYGTIDVTPYSVPEPSSGLLALMGAGAAGAFLRRRKSPCPRQPERLAYKNGLCNDISGTPH